MLDDSTHATGHGAVGYQVAVSLEMNFPVSLNKELIINLSNS
jgi:hypothetical protein